MLVPHFHNWQQKRIVRLRESISWQNITFGKTNCLSWEKKWVLLRKISALCDTRRSQSDRRCVWAWTLYSLTNKSSSSSAVRKLSLVNYFASLIIIFSKTRACLVLLLKRAGKRVVSIPVKMLALQFASFTYNTIFYIQCGNLWQQGMRGQ